MTIELADENANDSEEVAIAWLAAIDGADQVSIKRPTGAPLPFRVVRRVAGTEDSIQLFDNPVVSVHTFAATEQACKDAAEITHRRMLYLAQHPETDIELGDGRIVNVEAMRTFLSPMWEDYTAERIYRKVARYQFALSFVAE